MSLRSAACACVLACTAAAGARAASGVVFNDENGNGILDPGEDAIASVEVSNGVDIARTDANGVYRLPERPGSQVFVIKPRGWHLPADGANIPRFHVAEGQFPTFPLRKASEPDSLRALVLTDSAALVRGRGGISFARASSRDSAPGRAPPSVSRWATSSTTGPTSSAR